ncbi:NifB/NifX family molybdenum-iron cluster-binding protein [Desulfovirgula thermocuniculi]|uniref:NifB/NifX family molybdenum-iron cluster-binding protein n=1 Tax=Desulfovirgula thermocuniculi TaxID=348842 RepID=UPI000407E963|nr:NifB/NifX family molybdenum-iron cluster-binding protein [Desulfovirgula thermocuniculi]
MKIALARWDKYISPLLDAAQEILLAEVDKGQVTSRRQVRLVNDGTGVSLPEQLGELGIDVLICGGISNALYYWLVARGIQVFPWVSGEVEEVLRAYLRGELYRSRHTMPGYQRWRRRHRRRWRRGW